MPDSVDSGGGVVTDAELVRRVAVEVMGYVYLRSNRWNDAICVGYHPFNPLVSDTDSAAVLDKMAADGFAYEIVRRNGFIESCTYAATFYQGRHGSEEAEWIVTGSRRRAITEAALKAALKAKGVEAS